MILAHHGGEVGLVQAVAAAVGTAPVLLAIFRAQLRDLVNRRHGHEHEQPS